MLAAALVVGLVPAALTGACTEANPETRCGGGAPQCCCDLLQEVDRYQIMCRAACEDNPEEPERSCVAETACGA